MGRAEIAEMQRRVELMMTVRDAPLTDLGREQCIALHKQSVEGVQRTAELIVSSPVTLPFPQICSSAER